MPRDGSNVYHTPPGTPGITNTTIASTPYNGYLADIEQDLNLPRPIVAGGTGATSAVGAIVNLSAETAAQTITNWDSAALMPGSYYAATTATGTAPVAGHAFAGICYLNEPLANPPTNQNLVCEAIDITDPAHLAYMRVMIAGVWGPWGLIIGNAVRYDVAQTLTPAQQVQARKNIYAAPFDALAYSGMQVNGSMDVSQELGHTTWQTVNGACICDGWRLVWAGGASTAIQGISTSPAFQPGFSYHMLVLPVAAKGSLAAGDTAFVYHPVEGFRVSRLAFGTPAAQPITIGFWSSHAVAGLFSGSVRASAASSGNRSYAFTYTQAVALAAQFNVVTIPGDIAGTWAVDNTIGMVLSFALADGGTYTAPSANAWVSGNYIAAPGQVNMLASTSNAFRITGVVVLPGVEAPPAARAPLIMRPYDQELLTCKRYFWKRNFGLNQLICTLQAVSATAANGVMDKFYPEMRAAPTFTQSGASQFSLQPATGGSAIMGSFGPVTAVDQIQVGAGIASGLVAGNAVQMFCNTAGAWTQFDARL